MVEVVHFNRRTILFSDLILVKATYTLIQLITLYSINVSSKKRWTVTLIDIYQNQASKFDIFCKVLMLILVFAKTFLI